MDKAIEYVLLRVEEAYYEQNPDIHITNGSCMKDEGLSCNCITGIAINYVGYLISICCNIQDCIVHFELSNTVSYMKVVYKNKSLLAITVDDLNSAQCYLNAKVCLKEISTQDQIHIAFRQYSNIDVLRKKLQLTEDIMKEIYVKKGIDYCYRLEIWILFLSALRAYSLKESGEACLAMAIYMFPDKTLSYIRKTVEVTKGSMTKELKELAKFLKKYSDFLEELKCISKNFSFYEFCMSFKELTTIDIGYFIEDIISNGKVLGAQGILCEIFSKTLTYNLGEKRKRGELKKIIDILNDLGFNGT